MINIERTLAVRRGLASRRVDLRSGTARAIAGAGPGGSSERTRAGGVISPEIL
jgi:hypothetical protein